jgi:hypothetical protein
VDPAVAPDPEQEHVREGVHDRDADAVEAARHLVGVLVELAAGMELGHDDLRRRHPLLGMDVGRDAAAVVAHRDRAVGVEHHVDAVAIACQRLVDRVVDDLVDHVMQTGAVVRVADIHARALPDGIEPAQDGDRLRAVIVGGRIGDVRLRGADAGVLQSFLCHRGILAEKRGKGALVL